MSNRKILDPYIPIGAWTRLSRVDPFDLGVSAVLVLFVLYFSIPILGALKLGGAISAHYASITPKAVLYAAIGVLAYMLGYWAVGGRWTRARGVPALFVTSWDDRRVFGGFVIVFAAGFMIKIVRVISGSHLTHQYIDPEGPLFLVKFFISLNTFHFIALAIAFTYYYFLLRKNDPRAKKWAGIAWSTFAFELACGILTTGARLAAISPVIIFLITKNFVYQRSHRRVIIAALLVVFVFFPFKNFAKEPFAHLRELSVRKDIGVVIPYSHLDLLDTIYYLLSPGDDVDAATLVMKARRANLRASDVAEFSSNSIFGRIGQTHTFSRIVDTTDDYLYGRNFIYILVPLGVPSAVIGKITGIDDGSDFPVKYKLTSLPNVGIGSTTMGDLYMNFGLAGIVTGMFLIGVLFRRVFTGLVNSPSESGIFAYSMLWIPFMHGFEQTISSAYGMLIQISLILAVIHMFMTNRIFRYSVFRLS